MTKGITRRWMINSLGFVLVVVVALEIGFAMLARGYYYSAIKQNVDSRITVLANSFKNHLSDPDQDFAASAREFIENFTDKDKMELMIISRYGDVVVTSSGFAPAQDEKAPDYDAAVKSEKNYGSYTGQSSAKETILAVTSVLKNEQDGQIGALRCVVSMEETDRQILYLILVFIAVGLGVLLLVIASSIYFINSIVVPVREMGTTARKIASGDFEVRIEKQHDDEIGDLSDTINFMAGELSAAERMKNDFISSVSHELRTPLTAIKGWGETIAVAGQEDKETFDKGIDVIIRESERISGIVEELLDFSKLQSGRMVLMMDRMDILAELGEAVVLFSARAKRDDIAILYQEPDMLPPVLGDKNRLKQVFVNIIDNAIKYSEPGSEVEITAAATQEMVVITIKDNGCGIKREDLPKVKEKFYKANSTRRGSGIGLALADEIITLHSGTLSLDSVEEEGTTVTITLPIMIKPPEETADAEGETEHE